jgi:two-component system OmpR family sensor kinase
MRRTSIRTRLLAGFLLVAIAAAAGLSAYFLGQIQAFGMRRLDERLRSEANVAASVLGAAAASGGGSSLAGGASLRAAATLAAATKASTSRIVVVDAAGKVVADSAGTASHREALKSRPEVAAALAGRTGAATTSLANGRVELTIAAPVRAGGRIVGAAIASGSSFSMLTVLADYRNELVIVAIAFLVGALVITELLTRWLTSPLRELQRGAAALASDHSVRVKPAGPRETHDLAVAFNDLAEEIETSSVELHEEERRKSRFVSDVSHELRTPLTAIRGAAETLLEGDVPEEDAQRFLRRIVSEADRLARLANDLLNLQRIEGATGELPLSRVSLRQVAKLAVESLEPLADDRGVKVVVQGDASAVLGDRDRLQQVVANLVDNASRMTPAGGTVTVALASDGDRALLSVLDEGPGIPEADRPRLFDRFYRAQLSRDRSTGGAGLGLAIVKAIVTAHAGELEVANRPEGGARFTVRLPSLPDR